MSIERALKTVHSWLGVMILPWVVVAGLTGLYMNHSRLVLSLLPAPPVTAGALDAQPDARPRTAEEAAAIARAALPDAPLSAEGTESYRGRAVLSFDGDGVTVRVDLHSGYVWVTSRYRVRLLAPDGTPVATEFRWSRILSSLHERGWVGSSLGTWLADITAGALTVFGLTGLYLFAAPRLRRMKNRRARLAGALPPR